MKWTEINPPREYEAGIDVKIKLRDCGRMELNSDEQITFLSDSGAEYDVCKKSWGYYATPSVNGRLKRWGYKTAYVENPLGQRFVLLVEASRQDDFYAYIKGQKSKVVCWLDEGAAKKLEVCSHCRIGELRPAFEYSERPPGETDFGISAKEYRRGFLKCAHCGHYEARLNVDVAKFYSGKYVEQTYGTQLLKRFEQILGLPPEKSDNYWRVDRLYKWLDSKDKDLSVLDVGSGLCVFLALVRAKTSWQCTALDPDILQVKHAREVVGIEAIHGDFNSAENFGSKKFNLITFNKVLEHVANPISMLEKAKRILSQNGRVYIELPDGECAIRESKNREEFFIDHLHVYSMASLCHLVQNAGFEIEKLERIREPSSKFTLVGYLRHQ